MGFAGTGAGAGASRRGGRGAVARRLGGRWVVRGLGGGIGWGASGLGPARAHLTGQGADDPLAPLHGHPGQGGSAVKGRNGQAALPADWRTVSSSSLLAGWL